MTGTSVWVQTNRLQPTDGDASPSLRKLHIIFKTTNSVKLSINKLKQCKITATNNIKWNAMHADPVWGDK